MDFSKLMKELDELIEKLEEQLNNWEDFEDDSLQYEKLEKQLFDLKEYRNLLKNLK